MLKLQGDRSFPLPPEPLWAKLADLQFVVDCIPDKAKVREVSANSASLVLRPGFSFVRGEMALEIGKSSEAPSSRLGLALKTKGIGMTSEAAVDLALTALEHGTSLHWSVEVKQLGGLLKAVPQGLLQAAAQKVVSDIMSALQTKLGEEPVPRGPQ